MWKKGYITAKRKIRCVNTTSHVRRTGEISMLPSILSKKYCKLFNHSKLRTEYFQRKNRIHAYQHERKTYTLHKFMHSICLKF